MIFVAFDVAAIGEGSSDRVLCLYGGLPCALALKSRCDRREEVALQVASLARQSGVFLNFQMDCRLQSVTDVISSMKLTSDFSVVFSHYKTCGESPRLAS